MVEDLSVEIVHQAQIDELLQISPQFAFIKEKTLSENDVIHWNMNGKDAFCTQVMFRLLTSKN